MRKIINGKCPICNRYIKFSWKRFWVTNRSLCRNHKTPVSKLEETELSEMSDDDYIIVSDISEFQSKKCKLSTIKQYLEKNLSNK